MHLNWLILLVPVAFLLDWYGASPILIFFISALAIVPLAGLMGEATEALAVFLGPTVGGLLNATLGNAPEIIISAFALHAGLVTMVKSSLTGSLIGNLLFGLGLSFFAGGLKLGRVQHFEARAVRMMTALLTLASFALIIPAVTQLNERALQSTSRETALVLLLCYFAYLVSMFTNRNQIIGKEGVKAQLDEAHRRPDEVHEHPVAGWTPTNATVVLTLVTVGLAAMSEVLTRSIEPASESLHLSHEFAGVFLLAMVGNAAELLNAVRFARKDQIDLSIAVTVGASAQVAMLVAPVLVLLGMAMGQEMDLLFTPLELICIVMSIYLTRTLTYDGEASWLEGVMLIGVYILFGIGFFYQLEDAPATILQSARPSL